MGARSVPWPVGCELCDFKSCTNACATEDPEIIDLIKHSTWTDEDGVVHVLEEAGTSVPEPVCMESTGVHYDFGPVHDEAPTCMVCVAEEKEYWKRGTEND